MLKEQLFKNWQKQRCRRWEVIGQSHLRELGQGQGITSTVTCWREAEKRRWQAFGEQIWNATQTTARRLEGTETVFTVPASTAQTHLLLAPEGKLHVHPISVLSLLPRCASRLHPNPLKHKWIGGCGWRELMQSAASTKRHTKMNWRVLFPLIGRAIRHDWQDEHRSSLRSGGGAQFLLPSCSCLLGLDFHSTVAGAPGSTSKFQPQVWGLHLYKRTGMFPVCFHVK